MPEEIDPNQTSDERRFGKSFFGKPDPDIREHQDFIEQARLDETLRNSRPRYLEDGFGLQGPQGPPKRTQDEPRRTDFSQGSVVRHPKDEITQEITAGGTNGEPVDIYGAYNGQPAIFHLLQTAAPTPL